MVHRLAAVLSLDFLLISYDSVYSSVLHKKQTALFFFFTLIYSQSLKCPTTLKQQLSRLANSRTHELMSTTEAVSTLQLAEYCFGQIEELMRKNCQFMAVLVLQNQISNCCYTDCL